MFLIFFSPSVYERPLLLQSDNFVIKIHPGRRNCVNNLAAGGGGGGGGGGGRGRCKNWVNNLAVPPPPPPLW